MTQMTSCLICGESRLIEQAHIIPKRLYQDVRMPQHLAILEDTVPLCPTHHRLFDCGRLSRSEKTILQPYFTERLDLALQTYEILLEVTNSIKTPAVKKRYQRRVQRFNAWINRIGVTYA